MYNFKRHTVYIQSVSHSCIHSLKRYFSATKWDRSTICVVFYSLNFLKHVHVQNVHFLSQYTPNNDVEQSYIPSSSLLVGYHYVQSDLLSVRWTLDFSLPISREHCLNDFFGDHSKTCVAASAFSLSVELPFLPRRHFNKSCTVPSTSNLSRILVIVALVGGGVPNSTLQRYLSSTTFSSLQ